MKLSYKRNRPLINSILFGVIYLVTGILIEQSSYNEMFVAILVFLPGIIFPLITNNFANQNKLNSILYLIASSIIYFEAGAAYFYNDRTYHLIIIGTILSSFFYQILTKYFFKTQTPIKLILGIAILSGISFLPFQSIDWNYGFLGMGIFFWIVINSLIPNYSTAANRRQPQ